MKVSFKPLSAIHLKKFAIYFCASVDIRPLAGAWVADLLGIVLGVQDHKTGFLPNQGNQGNIREFYFDLKYQGKKKRNGKSGKNQGNFY